MASLAELRHVIELTPPFASVDVSLPEGSWFRLEAEPIVVDKPINLRLSSEEGNATLDAHPEGGYSRIFLIANGAHVELHSLTLTGGFDRDGGSALRLFDANVSMFNSSIIGVDSLEIRHHAEAEV